MPYRLSPLAEEDLRALWNHVAQDSSEERADRLLDAIFDRFDMLATHPKVGRRAASRGPRGRLQIAVHYPLFVRGFDRFCQLLRDRQRVVEWNGAVIDSIGERGVVHQLQHERLDAIRFLEAVNSRDVRVVQRGEDLRFAFEAGQPIGVGGEEPGRISRAKGRVRRVSRARYTRPSRRPR